MNPSLEPEEVEIKSMVLGPLGKRSRKIRWKQWARRRIRYQILSLDFIKP